MDIVWIILLLVGLIIAWFLGRSYYKDSSSKAISFLLLVLVAFFAAWLALKYSHEVLWDIKPTKSLWTWFILSSIIAFISLLLWNDEESTDTTWYWKAWCNTESKTCGSCGCDAWTSHSNDNDKNNCHDEICAVPTITKETKTSTWVPMYAGKPDDLKIIEWIGPVLEGFLNEHGVISFKQLWEMTPEQIKAILDRAGERFITHTTESRPIQARFAWSWRMKELKEMKDELDGGKFIPGWKYHKDSV